MIDLVLKEQLTMALQEQRKLVESRLLLDRQWVIDRIKAKNPLGEIADELGRFFKTKRELQSICDELIHMGIFADVGAELSLGEMLVIGK